MNNVIGIDPGQKGAFVLMTDGAYAQGSSMPLTKEKEVDFDKLTKLLKLFPKDSHVFLERAVPMAMGAKSAFSYGRSFAALEIALKLSRMAITYVEPQKWTKVMHEGINSDLKPKAKSRIALERLFPNFLDQIPKNTKGDYHEGFMDALLLAEYGRRLLNHV